MASAIPWLIKWMQSNSADYILAKRGFGMLNGQAWAATPALVELVQASDPILRSRAYGCFGLLGPDWTDAWPALVPVLHHTDPSIRTEAAEYLYTTYPQEADASGLRAFVSPRFRKPFLLQEDLPLDRQNGGRKFP
jgi:hypothetical protein